MSSRSASPPPPPRSWIERSWAAIAERGRGLVAVPDDGVPLLERAQLLATALLSGRGEASGAALARELHTVLLDLDASDRLRFDQFLAAGFLPEADALRKAAEAYLQAADPMTASRLTEAAEPPRQELLRRMNMSPGGTAALVAMRKEMLGWLRDHPELKPLDADLRHLFTSWFNRGFLELRRIDWQTPAAVLEKLITYEAVHEIAGWEDLRRRLAPDRRCFGFFHPALPGEPLIFVEVALVEGLAGAIQPLLAPESGDAAELADRAETAIFYSISNCQDGLRGVSFGNFLIKQVVEELQAELPTLRQFATLSPVPGFRHWLDARLSEADDAFDFVTPEMRPAVLQAAGPSEQVQPVAQLLRDLLRTDQWWHAPPVANALRPPLLRACAMYLTRALNARALNGKGPIDPVARFHLGNGARLERINWLGNTAAKGISESYGIMVNYLYDMPTIEANHEAFVRDGVVIHSASVDALIASSQQKSRKR